MSGRKESLTRRKLFKIGALGAATVAGRVIFEKAVEWYVPETDLSSFVANSEFRLCGPKPPEDLRGLVANSPFAWKDTNPAHIQELLKKCETLGANQIRIFLDDDVERKIGHVDLYELYKAKNFCREVWGRSQGKIKVAVDLFDCYRLLRSEIWNPNYGTKPLNSPYLLRGQMREELHPEEVKKRQREFFTDPKMIDYFKNRIQTIVDYLSDEPAISSWCVANEAEAELNELNLWYREVTHGISDTDPHNRPILSGVARPWYVDEEELQKAGVTANTLHWYDETSNNEYKDIIKYLYRPNHILPVSLQEIGRASQFRLTVPPLSRDFHILRVIFSHLKNFSFSFSPPWTDTFMSTYYTNTIMGLLKRQDKSTGGNDKILLPFFQLGGWQIQVGNLNDDGYSMDPNLYKETAETFNEFAKMFGKVELK